MQVSFPLQEGDKDGSLTLDSFRLFKQRGCRYRSAVFQWDLCMHWGNLPPVHRANGGTLKSGVFFEPHTYPGLHWDHISVLMSLPIGIKWSGLTKCCPKG